jgi:hypothetical protein
MILDFTYFAALASRAMHTKGTRLVIAQAALIGWLTR